MAKKPLLSLPINAQLVSNMQRITKALLWKGAVMIIFFGWMPEINFFQLPKLNKYCLGVELAPAHQVIKKAQNGSSVGLHVVSHFMPQRLPNVIKKKPKGHASYWNFEYIYSIRNKHLEISCKIKVLIKSYSACNRRNELLGHPVDLARAKSVALVNKFII